LDVFSSEPVKADNSWVNLDNVIITPHMAGLTQEAALSVSIMTAEGVLAVLNGQRWAHVAIRKSATIPNGKRGNDL
jgi:D-3-phosphoglycerate dehydrogenase